MVFFHGSEGLYSLTGKIEQETDKLHLRSGRRATSPSLVAEEMSGSILGTPDAFESLKEAVGICHLSERGEKERSRCQVPDPPSLPRRL